MAGSTTGNTAVPGTASTGTQCLGSDYLLNLDPQLGLVGAVTVSCEHVLLRGVHAGLETLSSLVIFPLAVARADPRPPLVRATVAGKCVGLVRGVGVETKARRPVLEVVQVPADVLDVPVLVLPRVAPECVGFTGTVAVKAGTLTPVLVAAVIDGPRGRRNADGRRYAKRSCDSHSLQIPTHFWPLPVLSLQFEMDPSPIHKRQW